MRGMTGKPLRKMGGYVEFLVYLASLTFLLNLYGIVVTFFGFWGHLLTFLNISCALFGVLLRFRLARPKDTAVQNFFGNDWGAYKFISGEKKIESDYCMKVVAHRACGLDAPENSISAIQKAHQGGISAVEFDVMMTSDNVPIVFHDDNLFRLTAVNKLIRETKYEEIKKLDISVQHPFGKNFQNERIPTLKEYVLFCLENQIRMFLDLKDAQKNVIEVISDLYKQHPKMYELAVVSSFNPIIIYKIRSRDPNILCCLAWRPYFYSHEEFSSSGPHGPRTTNLLFLFYLRIINIVYYWFLRNFGYYLVGISALLLHKDIITREIIQYWKNRGVRVIAWSINLPTEKQYFEKILEITYLTDTVLNR